MRLLLYIEYNKDMLYWKLGLYNETDCDHYVALSSGRVGASAGISISGVLLGDGVGGWIFGPIQIYHGMANGRQRRMEGSRKGG